MSVDLARLFQKGTYTPRLSAGSGLVNQPNLGDDGEAKGAWIRTGPLCRFWARFFFSGTNVDRGSGTYSVWLPFQADVVNFHPDTSGSHDGANHSIGVGRIRSSTGSASRLVDVVLAQDGAGTDNNPGRLVRMATAGSNAFITNTASAGDWTRIAVSGRYLIHPTELAELAG